MPPRPKTAATKSTATARATPNAGVGHGLGPVTVAAPKSSTVSSKRRKDDYVEISSSASSDGEQEPEPFAKSAAKSKAGVPHLGPLKAKERATPTGARPPRSLPPPPPTTALPPPRPAKSVSIAAPASSKAKRPRSPSGRTAFSSYSHEARVSRAQVEQEWTLVPSSGRRLLRDQVEQTARETVKDWSGKLSAKQLKSFQAALADFADDFDQLLTGVPIPPLPSPLVALDPNTTTSRKKARLKAGPDADEPDWVWSLEALEAKNR